MKKLLFIAHKCPPSGGGGVLRTAKFLKYLHKFSWKIFVVTGKPKGIKDDSLTEEIYPSVEIYPTKSITPHLFFSLLKKIKLTKLRLFLDKYFFLPDKIIGWIPFAANKSKKLIREKNIDIIYTTSPPHSTHFIGLKLKKKHKNLIWICDFRDAWCENPFRDTNRTPFLHKIEERMERKIMNKSDKLIFNTHSSLKTYLKKYGSLIESKSYVIPNGFDNADFLTLPKKTRTSKFTILYTGDVYGIRSLKPFLNGLEIFLKKYPQHKDKIKVIFRSYFIDDKEHNLIKKSKIEDLFEFKDFLPHKKCLEQMQNADLLLLITGLGEEKVMIPGKFYEYLGSGSPILAISEKGELTGILDKSDSGGWATLRDYKKISEIIEKYFDLWLQNKRLYPNKKEIMLYDRLYLTEQLHKVLSDER